MDSRWKDVTPFLLYCAFFFSWGGIMFGLDTGSFGSIQALPSWLKQFGSKTEDGDFVLGTQRKAIMNSIVWPGKLLGTIAFEPLAERLGYKQTIYFSCFAQVVGVLIEITAKEWVQFSVGRIVAYFTVGIVENVVPAYQAEVAPASLRGVFSGSLICIVTLGNMWGAGMGRATAGYSSAAGWLIPVGVQFIPAVILLAGVPFTIESPRWLVSKGKNEMALKNLNRIRPKRLAENGTTAAEISALDEAVEASNAQNSGSWLDLFRGTYLRRTIICSLLFWFQQSTGTQFVNSYGPTFFKQMGLGSNSFTYSFLAQTAGFVSAIAACLVADKIGRRTLLISGCALTAFFNFMIAGLGTRHHINRPETNMVIASTILLTASAKYSTNMLAYLITSEIGGVKMRKKTIAFATAIDVLSAFIVTFCIPYLLSTPGANLGAGVGWILGGDSILALIFAILFVPELKGRSLEEVDELFEANLWAWEFGKYQTVGIGSRIAQLEDHNASPDKILERTVDHVEEEQGCASSSRL